MFSLRFTTVLLIFLMVPFIFRFKLGNRFEPFPAILLPAGASKVKVGSSDFKVDYIALFAQKDGNWERVDAALLLYPIPATNHIYIFSRGFGLIEPPELEDRLLNRLLVKLNVQKKTNPTEQEKDRTKNWIVKRLKKQGFTGSILKIVQKEEIFSIHSGELLSECINNEKDIYLD